MEKRCLAGVYRRGGGICDGVLEELTGGMGLGSMSGLFSRGFRRSEIPFLGSRGDDMADEQDGNVHLDLYINFDGRGSRVGHVVQMFSSISILLGMVLS